MKAIVFGLAFGFAFGAMGNSGMTHTTKLSVALAFALGAFLRVARRTPLCRSSGHGDSNCNCCVFGSVCIGKCVHRAGREHDQHRPTGKPKASFR